MKAMIVQPPPTERYVELTMTERQAQILMALVGGIEAFSWAEPMHPETTEMVKGVWEALTCAGISAFPQTFSDFFTGRVACK